MNMTRKSLGTIRFCWVTAMLTLFVPALSATEAATARRPNIIVIVADDLGYADVGFQGGKEIPTPHIDALAKSGIRCSSGYVSCPVCSPTRAGLATGRYQQRFGHELNPGPIAETGQKGEGRAEFGLPTTEATLAGALKNAGYATGAVGKWHLGFEPKFRPLQRGFDEYFGFLGGAHGYLVNANGGGGKKAKAQQRAPIYRDNDEVKEEEYLTDAFTREAVSYIERHREKPFFLYLTYNAVHTPLQSPQKYLDRFPNIDDSKHRAYAAMLSALDDGVGKVTDKLGELKLAEDTLIFFISDNGGPPANTSSNLPLNGRKATVWEGGIRVPFIVSWKGHLASGTTFNEPVISLDIFPTAVAAAGGNLPKEQHLDGVDLLPYLTGKEKGSPHEVLYWRFGPQYALRKGNYKIVKTRDEPLQLFDLQQDIGEKTDLAASKPEIVKQLSADYDAWNRELKEPLWGANRR